MAHEKVYGFCENKCKVEVAPKTQVDAMKEKLDAIELNNGVLEGEFSGNLTGYTRGGLFVPAKCTLSVPYNSTPFGKFADFAASKVSSSSMYQKPSTATYTFSQYELYDMSYPFKLSPGLYLESIDDVDLNSLTSMTQDVSVTCSLASSGTRNCTVYINGSAVFGKQNTSYSGTETYTLNYGDSIYANVANGSITINAITGKTFYLEAI